MITPKQTDSLIDQFVGEIRLPLTVGDRIDVAKATITSVVSRLAPMITLPEDGIAPLPIEGAEPKKSEEAAAAE